MILTRTREELAQALSTARRAGTRTGLVPTMGFLHEGHLSLVDLVGKQADLVAVSIFVNPLQFGMGEDLDRYPRDLERDLALLEERGVAVIFHPNVREMYPGGDSSVTVDPGPLGEVLCGAFRPGHFRGVLTVVAKLLGLFRPDVAAFGQKDFQQAVLIKRMVRDLALGTDVLVGPIVREADGLAMSSRNVFLQGPDRESALGLHRGLMAVQEAFAAGKRSRASLQARLLETISHHGGLRLQYGDIVDPDALRPVDPVSPGAVAVVAARCGSTRLIDNHILVA